MRTRILPMALAWLLGVAAGFGALLAVAAVSDRPPAFLLAGLAASCAVWSVGALLATRGNPARGAARGRAVAFGVGGALLVVGFAGAALLPLRDPRLEPAAVAGQRFWELPTGSRIAYVRVPAEGAGRPEPVLFLHGGPGVPDMRGDADYFGRLARDGFDVYVYDQLGSGRSTRLADPRGYTLARDVADLEAIRRAIGAERVILVGHSYGGALAAAYAAAHGERVARLVLSSPDDPAPDAGGASMLFRLPPRERLGVYALATTPRPLLAWALLQVNPAAAHAFAGDAELDARQDRVYDRARPALHCRDKPPGPELHGLGFYANQFPQSATRPLRPDFLPDLAGSPTPTLVVKGRCDYLSWSSAAAYLSALPESRLVYLENSGHNAYQDEPERFLSDLRAFLLDRPLPAAVAAGSAMPADYEGPP